MDKDMGLNPNDLSGAAGGSREEPAKRRAQDGKELSLDELETVSGGEDRNWLKEGCAATVEAGSWCGRVDAELDRMKQVVDARTDMEPFALIGALMKKTM